jgi:crotonobetainyl-CoA:carnitine CoA-transferase CaiB-like acyl-CoA transferase
MTTNPQGRPLLEGIRILDLADEKASFCSKLLADLGADVVKVERPGGDPSRNIGPFVGNVASPDKSLFFSYHNTNKRSITLELEKKEGRDIFRRLIEKHEIVVETFPPGYLQELGLGYDALTESNPRLILVSVTGFGQKGPRSRYKSCDLVASAFGGQMYVSGSPSGPPLQAFGEQSYYTASLFAAIGILLAVRKRARSGKGDHIDISLQEAVASTLDHVMVRHFYENVIAQRRGGLSWNNSFCIVPCKDGQMLITMFQQWETLIELMASEGLAEDLADDPWRDDAYRQAHVDHILEVVERWTRTHTTKELFELGQLMRFPWAPVQSLKEVLKSPQLEARKFFIEARDSSGEPSIQCPGVPYRFSHFPIDRLKRAPRAGRDNLQIYQNELGLTGEEMKRLSSSVPSKECRLDHRLDRGILSGLRVLDFSWVLAGPYATRILADFGAEVIKVQSRKTAKGAESNRTGYFDTWNRNKLGITLDMSHPEAAEIVLKLAGISDVVVENFSPRVMSNWGLDYARLREVKSDLIMVSLSAMGQDGPWKDFVAFGPTLQALSGLTHLTSFTTDSPMGLGYAHADPIIGLYTTLAILSALEYRDRTGEGQYIDISGFEAVCTLLGPALMDAKINQRKVLPLGNAASGVPAAPHGCYRCSGKDRWCVIAVFSEGQWRALRAAMGDPPWMKEERFSSLLKRREHEKELGKRLEEWTVQHRAEEVVQLLQEVGVAAGVVQDAEALANDAHLIANQFFVSAEHPVLGRIIWDRSPIRLAEATQAQWKAAPLLGADNKYVFSELLGFTETELSAYVEKGIIG